MPGTASVEDAMLKLNIASSSPTVPVAITMLVLTYVSMALRLWTRTQLVRRIGWDDIAMIITLVRRTLNETSNRSKYD
jgi:hypothetical protein